MTTEKLSSFLSEIGWQHFRNLEECSNIIIGQMKEIQTPVNGRSVPHQNMALKMLLKRRQNGAINGNVQNEIKTAKKLQKLRSHPFVMTYHTVYDRRNDIACLIMDYCPGGDLANYIYKQGRLSEDTARSIFRQICSGAHFLHSHDIAHRDLKPENILLDRNGHVRITDFDWAAEASTPRSGICGTPRYAPPEVFTSKPFLGHKVDVWTLGVVLFVMTHGKLPFAQEIICARNFPPAFLIDTSDELCHLIQKILKMHSGGRPSIPTILNHQWVRGQTYRSLCGDSPHNPADHSTVRITFDACDVTRNHSDASARERPRQLGDPLSADMNGLTQIDPTNVLSEPKSSWHVTSWSSPVIAKQNVSTIGVDGTGSSANDGCSAREFSDSVATSRLAEEHPNGPTPTTTKKNSLWHRTLGAFLSCVRLQRRGPKDDDLEVLRRTSSSCVYGYI